MRPRPKHLIRHSAATLVLAPGTSRWSRALPMVAARLNGVIDTHIVDLKTDLKTGLKRRAIRSK